MRKRILSLVLAVLMLLSVLPVTALAADGVDNAAQIAEYKGNSGYGGGNWPGHDDNRGSGVSDDRRVGWRQFYGLTRSNTLISTADETSGQFKIYLGTTEAKTEWAANQTYTVEDLADNGITIVPEDGYYVRQVLIGCADQQGYNCQTAKQDKIARLILHSTQTATVAIAKENLEKDAKLQNAAGETKYVWHTGKGSPSYVMVWLGKSPNPVTVTYDAGDMTGVITGDLVTYNEANDTLGNADASFDDNVITYTAKNGAAVVTGAAHTVLDMLNNHKTATKGNETYTFTGWKIYIKDTNSSTESSWVELNEGTINIGDKLSLYRDYKLVAQWKKTETCKVTFEFVSGTEGKNLPEGVTTQQPTTKIVAKDTTFTPSTEFEFDDVDDSVNDGKWKFQKWDPSSKTIVEDTVFTGTWVFIKNVDPTPSLTVKKSAMLWRCKTDDNGKVQWSTIDPKQEGVKVKFGDEILYTITVTNNTNEANSAGIAITDTFNGTGSLRLVDNPAGYFTLSRDETTHEYTITLKQPIRAKSTQSISLIYTVQYGDTVLGNGENAKYLTNVATVEGSTSTVKIPVDTDYFNLAVEKQWDNWGSDPFTVTVQLYANGARLEGQQKKIIKEALYGANWTVFEDLPLRENGKRIPYTVKETAIDGATFVGTENVDFSDGNGVKARDLFETNDGTGKWYATYYDTIAANGIIRINNRYFKNPIVVTKEVAKIMRGGVELTDKTSARAGDVIHYTITIMNNAQVEQTIKFLDQLNTSGSLTFTGEHVFENTSDVPGSYYAEDIKIAADTTIKLHAEYTVQAGDGQQVAGKDGYYVTNTITVYCGGAEYEASVSTKIEKDEDLYKIYVPIIKTLKNEGTNKFDTERFAFKPYVTGQYGTAYDWPSAYISIGTVMAGDSAKTNNEAAEGGKPYTVISLTQPDFDNLPTDEMTGLPYIWISETPGSNSRVTYDSTTYKLYLVPEKDSGSASALQMALLTDEAAALPSNHVYDPAETHTYYAIADLTEWAKDNSTPYDCAAAFVNYYDKQEHRDDTIPVIPQLNRDDHVAYIMGYPDGNVRPEGKITRAEACTIFFRLLTESSRDYYFSRTNSYTDVTAGDWYNNAISTLSNAGIVMGYNDGTFRPNQPITRGEMAKIIANFANLRKGTKSFTDLSGHWSKTYVELAAGNGWIAGYPDGSFRPDQKITRAETVTMINRVLERVPAKESRLLSRSIMLTFPDNNPGDWYYIAIQEASNSHEYQRSVYETAGDETWIKLIENVDWTKLER